MCSFYSKKYIGIFPFHNSKRATPLKAHNFATNFGWRAEFCVHNNETLLAAETATSGFTVLVVNNECKQWEHKKLKKKVTGDLIKRHLQDITE